MQQMVIGLVLLAQEHGAAIALPTLLLRSTYKEQGKYVQYSEVFDVARWHALTCKGLPALTDAPAQRVFSSDDLWKRHEQYIFEIRSDSSIPPRSRFEDLVMDATSHPSARIRNLIAQVAPPQPYACLHARIETDLNRLQSMSTQTQQMHFPWLAEQLRDNEDLRRGARALPLCLLPSTWRTSHRKTGRRWTRACGLACRLHSRANPQRAAKQAFHQARPPSWAPLSTSRSASPPSSSLVGRAQPLQTLSFTRAS